MKKVRVKFLESIAILGDPKLKSFLEEKYKKIEDDLKAREKPPSAAYIRTLIAGKKLADRYGEPAYGFARDMAWKAGDEAFMNAELAEKWQDAGTCLILEDAKKAA